MGIHLCLRLGFYKVECSLFSLVKVIAAPVRIVIFFMKAFVSLYSINRLNFGVSVIEILSNDSRFFQEF